MIVVAVNFLIDFIIFYTYILQITGTAIIDLCGICSEGNTGYHRNNKCDFIYFYFQNLIGRQSNYLMDCNGKCVNTVDQINHSICQLEPIVNYPFVYIYIYKY